MLMAMQATTAVALSSTGATRALVSTMVEATMVKDTMVEATMVLATHRKLWRMRCLWDRHDLRGCRGGIQRRG